MSLRARLVLARRSSWSRVRPSWSCWAPVPGSCCAGLRPLERIAATARSITVGSLDQRVPTPETETEVPQLALALNGMLDDLEGAFREREATEAKLRRFLSDASHELRTH